MLVRISRCMSHLCKCIDAFCSAFEAGSAQAPCGLHAYRCLALQVLGAVLSKFLLGCTALHAVALSALLCIALLRGSGGRLQKAGCTDLTCCRPVRTVVQSLLCSARCLALLQCSSLQRLIVIQKQLQQAFVVIALTCVYSAALSSTDTAGLLLLIALSC